MTALATAFVKIRPETDSFKTEAERKISRDLDKAGVVAGKALSESLSKALSDGLGKAGPRLADDFVKTFSDRVKEKSKDIPGPAPSRERTRKQGEESGGQFADFFAKKLKAADLALPPIPIGPAFNDADQHIRDLRTQLKSLSSQRIGIDVDAAVASQQVRGLSEELERLARESADIQVKADVGAAVAQLAAISKEVDRVDGLTAHVDVDVDKSAAPKVEEIGNAGRQSALGLAVLIGAGAGIGPAIIPVAAAAAAAILALGTTAASAFAGIGVGILAFQGIGEAVKAMGAAEKEAAKSSASLAGAHNAVASAADGVKSAEASLANTRATVADQNRHAAQQVTDAERDLTAAQRDARDVVRELDEARQQASRRLADLNQNVKENALSQRQANLDIAESKKTLDKTLADPAATADQKEQARIRYEREVLQMQDLKRRGQELAQDQAKANKAGVDGSTEVVAAKRRISQADERVAEAQRAVSEARSAQTRAERQGQFQIAQAVQGVVSAQRSLGQASVAAGVAGGAAMLKLKDAMDGLSPAGQRFAKFLFGLKDELRSVRDAAAEGVLPGVQRGIEALLPFLPQVRAFVSEIAVKLGEFATRAGQALTSPFWKEFFGMIRSEAVPSLERLFQITGNLVTGFAGIVKAFLPLNADVGDGIVGLTAKFRDWATSLDKSEGFQRFLGYVKATAPTVLSLLGGIADLGKRLVVGLAPIGAGALKGLEGFVGLLNRMSPSVLAGIVVGIGAIATAVAAYNIVTKIAAGVTIAWGVAQKVAAVASTVWAGAQWLLNAALTANPIGLVIVAVAALVAAIVIAYKNSETFRDIVQAVWRGIQTAVKFAWERVIKPAVSAMVDFFQNVIAPVAMWLWKNVISPVWTGISLAIQVAWKLIEVVFKLIEIEVRVVAAIFMWLWQNAVKPAWDGIKAAISATWNWLKKNVFDPIWNFLKATLGPVFTWLWQNAIKPAWDGIKTVLSTGWNFIRDNIFNPLANFVTKTIPNAFTTAVTAIGKAWDKVKEVAKIPVKFIIQTVINDGLIAGVNWIASKVGASRITPVPLPKGFASGGILPGYTPGKDVHRFVSATGGALDLSGGEAIMRPEFVRAVGAGTVHAMNALAKSGGAPAIRDFMSQIGGDAGSPIGPSGIDRVLRGGSRWTRKPSLGGFADGGIIGALSKPWDAAKKLWDIGTDPAGLLATGANKLIAKIPGVGAMKDVGVASSKKAVTGVVNWVKAKVAPFIDQLTGVGAALGKVAIPASLLGRVQTAQTWLKRMEGTRYSYGGFGPSGFDCSAAVSAVYNIMKGQQPFGGVRFTTHNEGNYMTERGPGVLTAGWVNGGVDVAHTSGIIGGLPFEQTPPGLLVGKVRSPVSSFPNIGHPKGLASGGVLPAKLFDSGGRWEPGTYGYNGTGRTEYVSSPDSMDAVIDRLERLIDVARGIGGDVGREMNGLGRQQLVAARSR